MRGALADGERLKGARLALGLTQEQLARIADVDVKTVRKAEQGKRLDLGSLANLAMSLQLDVAAVMPADQSPGDLATVRRSVVERWVAVWDTQEIDALMSLYHEQAVMELPGDPALPFGGRFEGKAAIRRAHELAWETVATMPVSPGDYSILVDGDAAVLQGVKQVCLPDGRRVPLSSVHIYHFEGELIRNLHVEFDTLAMNRLRELPPEDSTAAAEAQSFASTPET